MRKYVNAKTFQKVLNKVVKWLCKFSSPNEASEIQALVSSGEYSFLLLFLLTSLILKQKNVIVVKSRGA